MRGDSPSTSASFDPFTMAAFQDYLRNKYSQGQLLADFDIPDIDTFHYGDWLIAHGQDVTWPQFPYTGLTLEYFFFLMEAEKDFFGQLVTHAHDYAMNTYGRTFTVSCNTAFAPEGYAILDKPDYMLNEANPFGEPVVFTHPQIKSFAGMRDWPVLPLPEAVGNTTIPHTTHNLIKIIMADIYASGGIFCFGQDLPRGWDSLGTIDPVQIDFSVVGQYERFILGNPSLFENRQSLAKVALINAHSSRLAIYWEIEPFPYSDGYGPLLGVANLMSDCNIQYDVLFMPDQRFSSMPSLTFQDLQEYPIILLPCTFALDDDQVQLILDYMFDGGTVVSIGMFGTSNPDGSAADRPEILALQDSNGVFPYGSGYFVNDTLNLGQAYLFDWYGFGIPQDSVRSRFRNLMLPHIDPQVVTSGVSQVYRPGGATGFLWEDASGNYLVHLVNYDFDESIDAFSEKQNFELCVAADTTRGWQAIYISPDFIGQQLLPTYNDSGYVCITIPQLEAYGIVVLQENESPPELLSQTPQSNVTMVSGDLVELIPEVWDPDGNPLYYQWYVNGIADALGTDPIYLYGADPLYIGTDTIDVDISDGYHQINARWIVTALEFPYEYPTVMFDETHFPAFSSFMSGAIEAIIADWGPDYDTTRIPEYYCGELVATLEEKYIVYSDTTGPLSSDDLNDADILFFPTCRDDISSAERDAIRQYVQSGGKMLIIGTAGWYHAYQSSSNLYHLLDDFGFRAHNPALCSLDDTTSWSVGFYLELQGLHPATNYYVTHSGLPILYEWGHKLEATGQGAQIIETTGDLRIWEDNNWNQDRDEDEPLESDVGIIGVNEYGGGKVAYISFLGCTDKYVLPPGRFGYNLNNDLFISVMKWLAEGFNPNFMISTDNYDFGQVQIGTTTQWELTIFNRGNADVEFSNIELSNPEFIVDTESLLVPEGEDGTLTITFAPTDVGYSVATLTADTDDPHTPNISVFLTGEGANFDADGDGVLDGEDNCPEDSNPEQEDTDADGTGDVCDNCPDVPNPDQEDRDLDNIGDVCDPCPDDQNNDMDEDGLCGNVDNCPCIANPDQTDSDGNGMGDVCAHLVGDVDGNCTINILDVLRGVNIILQVHSPTEYENAAINCNGDENINIIDILGIVNEILGIGECSPVAGKPIVNDKVVEFLRTLERHLPPEDYNIFMEMVKAVWMVPEKYSLNQNYPNPFNPMTEITFGLPEQADVKLKVYNILGQIVEVLVEEELPAGNHRIKWDGGDAASGVYFYRLEANDFTFTKRMVLMK